MIDWHSHILPAMDDGSKDPDESIAMIDALSAQGIDTVVATPHFLANEETADTFLERRKASLEKLSERGCDQKVRIVCGAEVKYYPGISRMEDLNRLTIGDSNLLLLEMPFAKWSEHTVAELFELVNLRGLKIIMAHIERYLALQDKQTIERLIDEGFLMQVNGSYFNGFFTGRKAIKLLASGYIHFVGSDCHNMTTRAPALRSTYERIEKKLGSDFLSHMNEFGYRALAYQSKL